MNGEAGNDDGVITQNKAPQTGRSRSVVLLISALMLTLPLVLLTIARIQGPQLERDAYASLEIVARLKVQQLESWLAERRGDGKAIADDVDLIERIAVIQRGADPRQLAFLRQRLDGLRESYGYPAIHLLSPQGVPLLAAGGEHDISAQTLGMLQSVLANGKMAYSDFYLELHDGLPSLSFVVPLYRAVAGMQRPVAALVLHVEPDKSIFPLILAWPSASASSETLLVRREGDSVVFLNQLRHAKDTALKLKRPLSEPALPAAAAVRAGQPGMIRGRDYRGIEVLASYRPVTGTDWHIVSKVDSDEVMAPLWNLVTWVGLLILAAIVAISLLLRRYWSQGEKLQQLASSAKEAQKLHAKEAELRETNERLEERVEQRTRDLALAKEAAEASDRFMHLVADAIPGQIAYVNREMRYEFANKAYREWFGKTAEEMRNIHLRDLLGEELFQRSLPFFNAALSGESLSFLRTRTDPEGKTIYLWSNYVPDVQDGQVRGIFGLFSDITELKNAQLQLEQVNAELKLRTVQAEAANVAKSDFLANISHELRTPLGAVIGMASLARGITSDPRQRDYLDKISIAGKHLSRIINDLLDLSKITAGYMEFESVPFSLKGLLARCKSVMMYRADQNRLTLTEAIDAAVPDVLLGDPVRIEQIILNLIGNAIKFTPAGRVEVRVGLHKRDGQRACLNIDVEDTGLGMRPEELERLFKPFSQGHEAVSRQFGGTGLGLTISKRLANLMDGDITVSSREGVGSTFSVRIWLGVGQPSDLRAMTESAQNSPQVRYEDVHVLVVDDQPFNREVANGLLTAVGITTCLVSNGQEALDIIASGENTFDLVLMDVRMPVMDGLTATRAIRNLDGLAGLPIVAMTAQTMAHEIERSTAAGMNDHIGKPFDEAGFYRVLAKWISSGKQNLQAVAATGQRPPNDLPAMRGIDTRAGLALLLDDQARYRHWLSHFIVEGPALLEQVRLTTIAGQRDSASMAAHTLKGRAGLLGMHELQSVAAALERAIDNAEPTDHLLLELEQCVTSVSDEIGIAIGFPDDAAVTTESTAESLTEGLPPGEPPPCIGQLIGYLQTGNSDCDRLVADCLAELGHTAWAPRLRQASIHIHNFDFMAAGKLLGSSN